MSLMRIVVIPVKWRIPHWQLKFKAWQLLWISFQVPGLGTAPAVSVRYTRCVPNLAPRWAVTGHNRYHTADEVPSGGVIHSSLALLTGCLGQAQRIAAHHQLAPVPRSALLARVGTEPPSPIRLIATPSHFLCSPSSS